MQPSQDHRLQRTVQPRSLTNLQQGPDGTFYDAQGLPLSLHANELFHQQQQQQQQYAQLSGPPQQPPLPQQFAPLPPHALHYEHQFAPQQQYAPQAYQQIQQVQQVHHPQHHAHATSPPFGLTPGPVPGPAHQIHTPHVHTPIHTTPRIAQRPLQIVQQPISQSPQQQQYSSPLEIVAGPSDEATLANHGQFKGLKLVSNPPNLEEWRQRLFDVDDIITLTEEQFQTYFPHIDNVYSHRSTQRHKRKSFVSHYWDCRLKGRPPGTKKSTDPDKKKRKRVARERDLCDVKIKITEFFDQKEYEEQMGHPPLTTEEEDDPMSMVSNQPETAGATADQGMFFGQQMTPQQTMTPWGMQPNIVQPGMNMFAPPPPPLPGPPPKKYYTFQRVNGNGGNGKKDGVAGPHKHTLEESDRVKKNIVIRTLAKSEKDVKKVQGGDSSKKTYHKKATGNAATTVKNHAKEEDLKLYGSCFCPFVQRVWISLEHKKTLYQYIEVDPYKKPQSLLDVNPRGLVPAIRHGPTWSTHESTVIMEYLEDLNAGEHLLPPDPQTRATSRLWSDHVNRHVIPMFYKLLQAQDQNDQITHAQELRDQINKLVSAADKSGPFFLGPQISFVDVQVAPWVLRLRRVLGPYRGWPEPEEGSRWKQWVDAIENEPSVKSTTSTDELYLDSYERYAENRPGTSQLADAVNSGRGLP